MSSGRHHAAPLLLCLLVGGCALAAPRQVSPPPEACAPPGQWSRPGADGPTLTPADRALAALAERRVVLLGETHDDAEHHRWQLSTVAGLHALHPAMALGFEMFPRRVQPVLDLWVAGRLTDREFLRQVEWERVWGYDSRLYLPLFHFARMHRLPMLALNVERSLVGRVGEQGWAAIPTGEREGVSDPAPASPAYLEQLYPFHREHRSPGSLPGDGPAPTDAELRDPAFRRFVEAMLAWDRAMAQGIAEFLRREPDRLVVAVMGSGHLRHGHGVPHQLRSLGVAAAVVLPWDGSEPCADLVAGVADVVFGLQRRPEPPAPDRPRLGISFDRGEEGLVVREVAFDSPAERAGLKAGDLLVTIAGVSTTDVESLVSAVRRVAPGTWLPLRVRRGGETLELIAKFPPP